MTMSFAYILVGGERPLSCRGGLDVFFVVSGSLRGDAGGMCHLLSRVGACVFLHRVCLGSHKSKGEQLTPYYYYDYCYYD